MYVIVEWVVVRKKDGKEFIREQVANLMSHLQIWTKIKQCSRVQRRKNNSRVQKGWEAYKGFFLIFCCCLFVFFCFLVFFNHSNRRGGEGEFSKKKKKRKNPLPKTKPKKKTKTNKNAVAKSFNFLGTGDKKLGKILIIARAGGGGGKLVT